MLKSRIYIIPFLLLFSNFIFGDFIRPRSDDVLNYIHILFEFSAEESCGKCFPGRLGSYRGKEMFDQAKNKTAKIPLKLLNELLITMQKGCLCALCGAIPMPIMNILKYFSDEMKNDMMKDN